MTDRRLNWMTELILDRYDEEDDEIDDNDEV